MSRNIPDKDLSGFDLRSLQQITLCSEPALQPTVTGFLDKFSVCGIRPEIFANCYAMAENTFAMTSTLPGDFGFVEIDSQVLRSENRIAPCQGGRTIASAGVPLPNINIRIADEEGNDIRGDKIGEVLIKSDCMLEHYHNNPEATANAFSHGFFKTGDLGFVYENQLYIVGRRKDMIIINGENIYPQDIELLLNEEASLIPGRNVVFGIDDERRGTESIIVLAEVKSGCEKIDTTALRAKIFNLMNVSVADILLLPHMALRKGTAGKISRFLNKEAYLAGEFNPCLAPKTKTEDGLKDIVLGVIRDSLHSIDAIDEQTRLFSTGLIDSLGTQELILAIQNTFNVIMPTYAFWGNNDQHIDTLADIRKWIGLNCKIFDNNDIYRQLNLPKVVAGKDNYLFYFQEIQYYWQSPYTNEELASIRRILEERRNWLAARDIEYLFMIVPNKASIYPEYLPDNILSKIAWKPSRYDQLIDYLKNHSDLNVLDLKEILLSVKNDVPLYYRTDTHYNKLAVCYVSNGIIRFLQDRFPFCRKYKESVCYRPLANIPYKGDMARLLQVEGESIEKNGFEILGSYRNRIRTAEQHLFVNEADDAPPLNLMLLGDSFGRALEGSILDQFAKKTYYAAPTDNQQANMPIDTALIDRFQPNVVVNEIIERFLVFNFVPNSKPFTDAAEYMPALPKFQSFLGKWPVEIRPVIQETTSNVSGMQAFG
jgi:acyl carrier protein